jgi:hypothetical protein
LVRSVGVAGKVAIFYLVVLLQVKATRQVVSKVVSKVGSKVRPKEAADVVDAMKMDQGL